MSRFIFIAIVGLLFSLSADAFEVNGISYNITQMAGEEKTVEVSHGLETYYGEVVIPESIVYNGFTFKVTRIGISAFSYASQLKSVMIPSSVKSIESTAFLNCQGLTSMDIPSSVENIGDEAFKGCINLRNISFENSKVALTFGLDVFKDVPLKSVFLGRNVIGTPFAHLAQLKNVTFGTDVTAIGDGAFEGCMALDGFVLPYTVTEVGKRAFANCVGLTSFSLSDGIETIGSAAFEGCTSLVDVELPQSVSQVNSRAFANCSRLSAVKINNGDNALMISESVFQGSPFTSLFLGRDILLFPNGNSPFKDSAISALTLGDKVQRLIFGLFENCTQLTELTIPSGLNYIGGNVFKGCAQLSHIKVLATEPPLCFDESFDRGTFENALVEVPESVLSAYLAAQGWKNFKSLQKANEQVAVRLGMTEGGQLIYNGKEIDAKGEIVKIKKGQTLSFEIKPDADFALSGAYLYNEDVTNLVHGETFYLHEIDSDANVFVVFEKYENKKHLLISSNNGGLLNLNHQFISQGTNSHVNYGDSISISFTPYPDYRLSSFLVNGKEVINELQSNVYKGVMNEDMSIMVLFEKIPVEYALTLEQADNGSTSMKVDENSVHQFSFAASKGWHIHNVTFNDVDVTSDLRADHVYTTPAIMGNSTLSVTYEKDIPTALQEIDSKPLLVRGYKGCVTVSGVDASTVVSVYTTNGKEVARETAHGNDVEIILPTQQVYIVKVGARTFKLAL